MIQHLEKVSGREDGNHTVITRESFTSTPGVDIKTRKRREAPSRDTHDDRQSKASISKNGSGTRMGGNI
jgi:hypothetical protein